MKHCWEKGDLIRFVSSEGGGGKCGAGWGDQDGPKEEVWMDTLMSV
jgi:hypothetical protein